MVRAAKREGLPVTCDVGVHHLHLCDVDIGWFDPQANLMPPLRGTRDRDALRAGLADGTIDAICSDHAPVDDDGKQVPFAEAEPGATGLELLLPLTLKWAAEDAIAAAAARSRDHVARRRRSSASVMPASAPLAPGGPVRFRSGRAVDASCAQHLRSQGKNTPFLGHRSARAGALHVARRAGRSRSDDGSDRVADCCRRHALGRSSHIAMKTRCMTRGLLPRLDRRAFSGDVAGRRVSRWPCCRCRQQVVTTSRRPRRRRGKVRAKDGDMPGVPRDAGRGRHFPVVLVVAGSVRRP